MLSTPIASSVRFVASAKRKKRLAYFCYCRPVFELHFGSSRNSRYTLTARLPAALMLAGTSILDSVISSLGICYPSCCPNGLPSACRMCPSLVMPYFHT